MSETARVEAFSDGVFAIAMTLLILDIKVPPPTEELGPGLARQWPQIAAFVVSFLYIGVYWMSHHRGFRQIARLDGGLLLLNLLFLMAISFVPFPTAVLADRLASGQDLGLAIAFYGVAMLLLALTAVATDLYAHARKLVKPGGVRALPLRLAAVGPIVYVVSIAVALVAPLAALVFYAIGPVYYAIAYVRSAD